jgi:hypothetical protein
MNIYIERHNRMFTLLQASYGLFCHAIHSFRVVLGADTNICARGLQLQVQTILSVLVIRLCAGDFVW